MYRVITITSFAFLALAACGGPEPPRAAEMPPPRPARAAPAPTSPDASPQLATASAGFPLCADVTIPTCEGDEQAMDPRQLTSRSEDQGEVSLQGVVARGEGACARTSPPRCETFLRVVAPGATATAPVTDDAISVKLAGTIDGRSLLCGTTSQCCPLQPGRRYVLSGRHESTGGDDAIHQLVVEDVCQLP